MKAAVCREFGKPLMIEELEIAAPSEGEVKVRIRACAVCHSDIYFAEGAWGGRLPAVYGHEAAGTVEAVGPGVRSVEPGDHVVVTLIRSCGHCHGCSYGSPTTCETSFPLDEQSPLRDTSGGAVTHGLRTGAFAEYAVVHQSQVVAIDRDMPFEAASLLACGVITGIGAVVNSARVRAGADVVVIGAGGVGLNAIQGAAMVGARTVIAVDIAEDKLDAAKRFGASHGINAAGEDASAAVRALTGGHGADYVLVTVGVKAAFDQAFGMLRRAGAVVLVGVPPAGVLSHIDPGTIASEGHRILGSKMGDCRIQVEIPMLVTLYKQKRLKLDELITGRYPLERINEAFASVNRGEALRNVIVF